MPIYAYKCESCGFAKDVLQKMSDVPLSVCPHCGESSFRKQLTAAGFQLKGSGWYVTDFRGGKDAPSTSKPADTQAAGSVAAGSKSADAGAAPATPAPAAAVPSSSKSTGGDASPKAS
jgi:putative FmdB family regulatory protein